MATPAPVIERADYHHAMATLIERLAFWLVVRRDAPDQGMGPSFIQDVLAVMGTAEMKYGIDAVAER